DDDVHVERPERIDELRHATAHINAIDRQEIRQPVRIRDPDPALTGPVALDVVPDGPIDAHLPVAEGDQERPDLAERGLLQELDGTTRKVLWGTAIDSHGRRQAAPVHLLLGLL